MRIQAFNTLTTNILLGFDSNTRGSDAQWEGKAAECKPALQVPLERGSPNGTTNRPMHLNLNQNRKYYHNSLSNVQLQRFTKNPYAFRYSEKQEHLNSAKMQIQAPSAFTPSVLQEFQQPYPRFRCSVGMKHRRMQIRPAGTPGKGHPEQQCKPPHASEPKRKPQILLQLTE